MEFNTNTTSSASAGSEGVSSVPFTWQNPVFPGPSPRARRANPDRLPGVLYSHAPRWTPGKHARILAQIKATRTDLDPSFPRPAAAPEAAAQVNTGYQLSEVISNLAQGTKSYFDGLTAYALEQLYGPTPAAPVTGAHPATASKGDRPDPEELRKSLLRALQGGGMQKDMATDIVLAWTANGIPINVHSVPKMLNSKYKFSADQKPGGSSGAIKVNYETKEGDLVLLKCYPPASATDLRRLNDMTGIDPQYPKFEARNLLAGHLAHEILGWDILPKTFMGFFGGRACVVTPLIAGISLNEAMERSLDFAHVFLGAVKDGVVHIEQWDARFTEQFKHDYMRLLVFTVLVGDFDRHHGQYIVTADAKREFTIKAVDWDVCFGSKQTDDMLYIELATGKPTSLWPSFIPQTICDEFNKLNEANLHEAAIGFGLTDEEVAALLSRFAVIKKKLATIKKA